MIQHLLAKFQISKMQEPKETKETTETKEPQEPETNANKANNATNPTNPAHLDTPFKLPMEYLPEDQLCLIDKSVLSDLELIECTKQVNDTNCVKNEFNVASESNH
jgi:hypothetical protein